MRLASESLKMAGSSISIAPEGDWSECNQTDLDFAQSLRPCSNRGLEQSGLCEVCRFLVQAPVSGTVLVRLIVPWVETSSDLLLTIANARSKRRSSSLCGRRLRTRP